MGCGDSDGVEVGRWWLERSEDCDSADLEANLSEKSYHEAIEQLMNGVVIWAGKSRTGLAMR